MLRLLLASPYPVMRAGLRALLDPQFNLVGESDSMDGLFEAVRATRPEVVLLDLTLDPDESLSGLWQLRSEWPEIGVLALSDAGADRRVLAALQAGARGCLPKTAAAPELNAAVRSVAAGQPVLPSAATAALLDQLRGEAPRETLSPREAEVLRHVAAGSTNKAIALKLGISEHTVKFHLGSAMGKLGAASRAEAVASAMRLGLISV
jgi:DNA-binding NarL/FixJ family response regulator